MRVGAVTERPPLDARLTFASFVVGRSNAWPMRPPSGSSRPGGEQPLYNPLYVHAGVGLGKTHLLHGDRSCRPEPGAA